MQTCLGELHACVVHTMSPRHIFTPFWKALIASTLQLMMHCCTLSRQLCCRKSRWQLHSMLNPHLVLRLAGTWTVWCPYPFLQMASNPSPVLSLSKDVISSPQAQDTLEETCLHIRVLHTSKFIRIRNHITSHPNTAPPRRTRRCIRYKCARSPTTIWAKVIACTML